MKTQVFPHTWRIIVHERSLSVFLPMRITLKRHDDMTSGEFRNFAIVSHD